MTYDPLFTLDKRNYRAEHNFYQYFKKLRITVHFQIRLPILRFRAAVVVVVVCRMLDALCVPVLRRPHRPRRRRRRALLDTRRRATANLHKVIYWRPLVRSAF